MKTKCILIPVPTEGPEVSAGWEFVGYSVRDEDFSEKWPQGRWQNAKKLDAAGLFYAYQGVETHSLIARCDHNTDEGTYEIYSRFQPSTSREPDADLYEWSPWINWNNGKPFDFAVVELATA